MIVNTDRLIIKKIFDESNNKLLETIPLAALWCGGDGVLGCAIRERPLFPRAIADVPL